MKKMHFISGLPRSGSTLLAALLRQNPRFQTGITSPVALLCGSLLRAVNANPESAWHLDEESRLRILRGLFDSFYANAPKDSIIFDTNHSWTGQASLIARLYSQSRIICCVREPSWILDSIERMRNENPTQSSAIFNFHAGASVNARAEFLMNADKGLAGQAWTTFREAWFGNEAKRLIVVPYDQLAAIPKIVLQQLYFELKEPEFEHDFDCVEFDAAHYGTTQNMPGLHSVRPKVELEPRHPFIPPELFGKYVKLNFWIRPQENVRGVCVLGHAYGSKREAVAH